MKMKRWFFDKMMEQVLKYGDMWENLTVERTERDIEEIKEDEDGYVHFLCRTEVLKESEKACQIKFGDVWTNWCPKSVIKF